MRILFKTYSCLSAVSIDRLSANPSTLEIHLKMFAEKKDIGYEIKCKNEGILQDIYKDITSKGYVDLDYYKDFISLNAVSNGLILCKIY